MVVTKILDKGLVKYFNSLKSFFATFYISLIKSLLNSYSQARLVWIVFIMHKFKNIRTRSRELLLGQ